MLDKERFLSQILSVFSNENCFKRKTFMFNLQMIFNFLINSNISSEKSFKLLCFRFQFSPPEKKQFPLQQRIVIELKWAQETFFPPPV